MVMVLPALLARVAFNILSKLAFILNHNVSYIYSSNSLPQQAGGESEPLHSALFLAGVKALPASNMASGLQGHIWLPVAQNGG